MRKIILLGLMASLIPLAGAQQTAPPAAQLIDRLYPGSSREIEKRLTTSSTLAVTPLASIRPSTGSLVLKFRRPKSDNQRASATQTAANTRSTTRTVVPVPLDALNRLSAKASDRPSTAAAARATPPSVEGGTDLTSYLHSLAKPTPMATPGAPARTGAATTKTTVAVPLERLGAVNVNRAGEAELMRVLKIDSLRAHMIVEFRTTQRPIRGPEDLAQVNGLTQDMVVTWQKEGVLKFD